MIFKWIRITINFISLISKFNIFIITIFSKVSLRCMLILVGYGKNNRIQQKNWGRINYWILKVIKLNL